MGKVIAVVNNKGGVAKTTTTEHLGIGLAKAGYSVLLIDADPQNSLAKALGVTAVGKTEEGMELSLGSVMDGFIMNSQKVKAEQCVINSLHGHKHLIVGNHDHRNLDNKRLRDAFDTIYNYGVVSDEDEKVVLFHYPIEQWDGFYRGYYHIHGHVHGDGSVNSIPRRFEASVEVTGYTPMTLEELKNLR